MQNLDIVAKFFNLKDSDLDALQNISTYKIYPPDSIIFYQGEILKRLIFLVDGYVGSYHTDDDYKNLFFHIFKFPGLVGEPFVFMSKPCAITAVTFTECKVVLIDYDKFKRMFYDRAEFIDSLILSLCGKVENYFRFGNREKHNSTIGKICYFLQENEPLFNILTQKNIAFILNLTPQLLSKSLKKLKDENILEFSQNRWSVADKNRLKEYANILSG